MVHQYFSVCPEDTIVSLTPDFDRERKFVYLLASDVLVSWPRERYALQRNRKSHPLSKARCGHPSVTARIVHKQNDPQRHTQEATKFTKAFDSTWKSQVSTSLGISLTYSRYLTGLWPLGMPLVWRICLETSPPHWLCKKETINLHENWENHKAELKKKKKKEVWFTKDGAHFVFCDL